MVTENRSNLSEKQIEGPEICLKCNDSRFGSETVAPNPCWYADLYVFNREKNALQAIK